MGVFFLLNEHLATWSKLKSVATNLTFLTRKQPMYDLKMGITFKFYCMSGNTLYLWLV